MHFAQKWTFVNCKFSMGCHYWIKFIICRLLVRAKGTIIAKSEFLKKMNGFGMNFDGIEINLHHLYLNQSCLPLETQRMPLSANFEAIIVNRSPEHLLNIICNLFLMIICRELKTCAFNEYKWQG